MDNQTREDSVPLLMDTDDNALSSANSSHIPATNAPSNSHSRAPSSGGQKDTPFIIKVERNLYYLKDQLEQFFASRTGPGSTTFVPFVCGAILVLYIVNVLTRPDDKIEKKNPDETDPAFEENVSALVKWCTLNPGYVLSPWHWPWATVSVFTYAFIELYLYQVVLDIAIISLSTTLIEPLWGKKELFQFFLVINFFVAVLTMSHYIMIYAVKGDAVYLYGVKIYGLSGYLSAISVTAKQLMPDSVIVSTAYGKMKNDNVPLTGLLSALVLYLLNLISGMSVICCLYGLLTAWVYLRFVQFHPTNGTRGDLSDSFSFATFFPNVLQPPVALISNTIYQFLVKIHVCSERSRQYQGVRVLSERLTDNFRLPVRNKHKYNPSGDYQHLHQPRVETL
ncbi:Transmembrane protein [Halotydeus destructor]|nr:Transmembrane protein [Halotydeus destructor]